MERKQLSLPQEEVPEPCVTNSRCVLQNRFEYGLKVTGRARDHLQHFSGGGLLLQGFAEIVRAVPQLVHQTGVLDGDDGLVRESLQHGSLIVRQRAGGEPHDAERADRNVAPHHRHDGDGAVAAC